jgi:type IX secretion system PorP/SprF family membrane protein
LSYGQDIHFTQFYDSPLTLNPALTGDFSGAWRVTAIGRQQANLKYDLKQGEPFNTLAIGIDAPIKFKKNKFGVGLYAVNDNSGQAKLNITKITATLAFETKVSGSKLRFGLQPSYVQFGTGIDGLVGDGDISDESDRYETGIVFGEGDFPLDNESVKYFDLHGGALWSKKFGKLTPTAGFSLYHILRPKYSVFSNGTNDRKPMRFVYNMSADYQFNEKVSLHPNFLFMSQTFAQDLVLGVNVGYSLVGRIELIEKVFIGPEFRMVNGRNRDAGKISNSDALAIIAGVKLPKWKIGIARDFTVSNLQGAFSRITGAWEVSIIFIAPDVNLKKKLIPCDRY